MKLRRKKKNYLLVKVILKEMKKENNSLKE